jgi:hypothetical protein
VQCKKNNKISTSSLPAPIELLDAILETIDNNSTFSLPALIELLDAKHEQ